MQVGRMLNDPRSTGLALALLTWIALLSDSYAEALEYSEQSLAVAVTPLDRTIATSCKGCALVLLRRTEEGAKILEEYRRRCVADGVFIGLAGSDAILGVCKVLQGNIRDGIHSIEEAILRREKEGNRRVADWYRLFLAEVYLQIIAEMKNCRYSTLLKNMPILLKVMVTASSRIRALMTRVLENPHFDPEGHYCRPRANDPRPALTSEEKTTLAVQHLTEAKRISPNSDKHQYSRGSTRLLRKWDNKIGHVRVVGTSHRDTPSLSAL